MYAHRTTVRLHDTDAAGVVYFASVLRLAHEAYEAAMEAAGCPVADVLFGGAFALPIVHAEADYLAPVRTGDRLEIRVGVKSAWQSSFVLEYRVLAGGDKAVAVAETAHAAIRLPARKRMPLPPEIKTALRKIGPA